MEVRGVWEEVTLLKENGERGEREGERAGGKVEKRKSGREGGRGEWNEGGREGGVTCSEHVKAVGSSCTTQLRGIDT